MASRSLRLGPSPSILLFPTPDGCRLKGSLTSVIFSDRLATSNLSARQLGYRIHIVEIAVPEAAIMVSTGTPLPHD
jgi:hypothetical protein